MFSKLYNNRFKIYLSSQLTLLFGSLVIPTESLESVLYPILFQINIIAGVLLLAKNKKIMWLITSILVITSVVYGTDILDIIPHQVFNFVRLGIYFIYHLVIGWHIIKQVWKAREVDENAIFGLISGYLSLGLIGFFICLSIEVSNPGAFQGLFEGEYQPELLTERLIYYSYITILTLGYGDILPVTALAQKAAVLIGLMGQFYLVIFTAVIISKYINQSNRKEQVE